MGRSKDSISKELDQLLRQYKLSVDKKKTYKVSSVTSENVTDSEKNCAILDSEKITNKMKHLRESDKMCLSKEEAIELSDTIACVIKAMEPVVRAIRECRD